MSWAEDYGWLKIAHDGREILDLATKKGITEYRRRIEIMSDRQKHVCCLYKYIRECPGSLLGYPPTFEHENGRGGGKRDDRIEVDGKWINGAAHALCNGLKGSKRIPYNVPANSFARAEHGNKLPKGAA